MCGRYTVAKTPDDLADYFEAEFDDPGVDLLLPTYNASPGQHLPTIAGDTPGMIRPMLWGITRAFTEAGGNKGSRFLINARSESVDSRPAFRESFRHRRCLVVADGFYEWKAIGTRKQPYRVVLGNRGLFAFAGIWEESSENERHFVILTTAADRVIRPIHDRMPVILTRSDLEAWLDPRQRDIERFTRPDPPLEVDAYPVSSAVNASRENHSRLIEPVEERTAPSSRSLFD